MAWEWSHTAQAVQNVKENLADIVEWDLSVMYAEWKTYDECGESLSNFDEKVYERYLEEARRTTVGEKRKYLWTRIREHRTCTNGGHMAHGCPYGCGPHLISFDRLNPEVVIESERPRFKVMKQAQIAKCPFIIIDPTHYREDGTCKCNDEEHREFMRDNWGYTDEHFRKAGLI